MAGTSKKTVTDGTHKHMKVYKATITQALMTGNNVSPPKKGHKNPGNNSKKQDSGGNVDNLKLSGEGSASEKWYSPSYNSEGKVTKLLVKTSLIPRIQERQGTDDESPRWTKMKTVTKKTNPFLKDELQEERFRSTTAMEITTSLHKQQINEPSYHSTLRDKLIKIIELGQDQQKANKPFAVLATRFARTPPEALPGYLTDGSIIMLLTSPFAEYWIGAVDAIGAEYLGDDTPTVFDTRDKPMPNSAIGRKFLLGRPVDKRIMGFENSEDLFQRGSGGAHDIMQTARLLLPKHKSWEAMFIALSQSDPRTPTENDIIEMGLRLAKTKPARIPGWVLNQLKSSTIADGWVGAQKVYGSMWHESIKVSFGDSFQSSTGPPSALKKQNTRLSQRRTR
jgi:hypothetical protein